MGKTMSNASSASPGKHRWEREGDMTFSLRDGFVWASWPDTEATVRLGRHDVVASMMRDFLAQDALCERLLERRARDDC
jgi:hypothetical protein